MAPVFDIVEFTVETQHDSNADTVVVLTINYVD